MLLTKKIQHKTCRIWRIKWKIKLFYVVECRGRIKEYQPKKRRCSVLWYDCCSYLCIVSQMAAGETGCCWGGCCIIELFGLCTGASLHRSSMLANHAVMMVMVLITCCTAVLCWVSEAGHHFQPVWCPWKKPYKARTFLEHRPGNENVLKKMKVTPHWNAGGLLILICTNGLLTR